MLVQLRCHSLMYVFLQYDWDIAKMCLKYPFCPLYSMEKRYQIYQKIQRKKLQKQEKEMDKELDSTEDDSDESD